MSAFLKMAGDTQGDWTDKIQDLNAVFSEITGLVQLGRRIENRRDADNFALVLPEIMQSVLGRLRYLHLLLTDAIAIPTTYSPRVGHGVGGPFTYLKIVGTTAENIIKLTGDENAATVSFFKAGDTVQVYLPGHPTLLGHDFVLDADPGYLLGTYAFLVTAAPSSIDLGLGDAAYAGNHLKSYMVKVASA
jgi:hypothetical protein